MSTLTKKAQHRAVVLVKKRLMHISLTIQFHNKLP